MFNINNNEKKIELLLLYKKENINLINDKINEYNKLKNKINTEIIIY